MTRGHVVPRFHTLANTVSMELWEFHGTHDVPRMELMGFHGINKYIDQDNVPLWHIVINLKLLSNTTLR